MRNTGFKYLVDVKVEFTKAEVEQLYKDSQRHYDLKCKSIGIPGRGAFLHGMRVSLGVVDPLWPQQESITEALSWDNIDTLCKVLEITEDPLGTELYMGLRRLFGGISFECKRLDEIAKDPVLENEATTR